MSNDSVLLVAMTTMTVRQRENMHNSPKTKAAKWNSAIIICINYTCFFSHCDFSKRPPHSGLGRLYFVPADFLFSLREE